MVKTYHIVLADDHDQFRRDLRRFLDRLPDLQVVGEAGDGLELMDLLHQLNPHLAILDMSMPKLTGIEAAAIIEKRYPELKVLILTIHNDDVYRSRAMAAGAEGYLPKDRVDTELVTAISLIRDGQVYFRHLL